MVQGVGKALVHSLYQSFQIIKDTDIYCLKMKINVTLNEITFKYMGREPEKFKTDNRNKTLFRSEGKISHE